MSNEYLLTDLSLLIQEISIDTRLCDVMRKIIRISYDSKDPRTTMENSEKGRRKGPGSDVSHVFFFCRQYLKEYRKERNKRNETCNSIDDS